MSERRKPGGVVTGEVEREAEPGAPAGHIDRALEGLGGDPRGAGDTDPPLGGGPRGGLACARGGQKVWVSDGLVVAAEAVFWVSALLLGREAVRRYLDPRTWSRKR